MPQVSQNKRATLLLQQGRGIPLINFSASLGTEIPSLKLVRVKNVLVVAAMACPQQVLGARAKAVSRRETDDADLAQPFDAERIDGVVWLVNENDLDVVHVSVHRHMIFGNVRIHANFVGARRLALGRDQTRGRTEQ